MSEQIQVKLAKLPALLHDLGSGDQFHAIRILAFDDHDLGVDLTDEQYAKIVSKVQAIATRERYQ